VVTGIHVKQENTFEEVWTSKRCWW